MNGSIRRLKGGCSRGTRTPIGGDGAAVEPLEPRLMMAADVLTYHNDNSRDGANLQETTLTTTNVNANTFGKLGQVAVDGQVYAQPLVKTGVTIPGKGVHNVVYVATENDSVYAYDANTLKPLWHRSLVNPAKGVNVIPAVSVVIYPDVGVTSTPVIDPKTNTMYLVANVAVTTPTGVVYKQQLHAIGLSTGRDKFGGPVNLQASAPGSGNLSVNGQVSFSANLNNQRPALILSNGNVYIAESSYGNVGNYEGWVMAYDAHTLKQVGAWTDSPDGTPDRNGAGIWMSGGGPAADAAGNVYLATGNGKFQYPTPNGGDFGDSVVKLSNADLKVEDFFTPSNADYLLANDKDLGSGAPMLLPDQPGPYPHLMVQAGKTGTIYLINRDNMGKFNATTDQIVQELPKAITYSFDTPAYWNGTIYYGGGGTQGGTGTTKNSTIEAFSTVDGKINPTPVTAPASYDWPGANPVISANGSTNGIVWAISGYDRSGTDVSTQVLHAYNASNISQELYNSSQAGTRDTGGNYVKFTTPTVANGRVYVAGRGDLSGAENGTLTMYGLLHPTPPRPAKGR
jgi:hypothetical protein